MSYEAMARARAEAARQPEVLLPKSELTFIMSIGAGDRRGKPAASHNGSSAQPAATTAVQRG
jgi:hypothetical protein